MRGVTMEIWAHRGADHKHCGENTYLSFLSASRLRHCDGIELDVRLTRDDQLVISHNAHIIQDSERFCIRNFTLEELVSLGIVADTPEKGALTRLPPTLYLVMHALAGRIPINIELKDPGSAAPLVTCLRRWDILNQSLFPPLLTASSFIFNELVFLFPVAHRIARCYLTEDSLDTWWKRWRMYRRLERHAITGLHIPLRAASAKTVRFFTSRGILVRVYTVNNLGDLPELRQWRVDGVFTDKAAEFIAWEREARKTSMY